ncbi:MULTISPECIES: hypothetical protein [unclassified Sphingobacterium]|uniref:hypothetical protein n=1 Tax=unclassified Sphingobacterium TaxID=2609468 RepID=UPI00104D868E|nr:MULTISPECIES: hypothetical protein [unclassified Sphingobacterium]MCS3556226.1 hypothetical protein [Sphingobacterium sp. JUb21]TCR08597.1 hypothetical protein EDF66_103144 [Sphingobacterium sp. JUb20]
MKKTTQLIVGFYAGIVTVAFLMLFYSFNKLHQKFDEITVKRINIVDDKGVNRMIISNQERMEPPILFGKKYKRALNPAGIIFYNEKGDECGGLAISKNPETNTYALAFDYDNADAIGILTQQSNKNNHYKSGIVINDKDLSGKIGGNTNRINLMTDNGNSGLVINGPDEKPRIIISVDSLGNPLFKILNNEGKLIKEINSSE